MTGRNEREQASINQIPYEELEKAFVAKSKLLRNYRVLIPLPSLIFQTVRATYEGLQGFEQLPDMEGSYLVSAHNLRSTIELGDPDHFTKLEPLEYDAAMGVLADISTAYNRLNFLSRQRNGKDYQFPVELIFPEGEKAV